jgi:hypothetical protein
MRPLGKLVLAGLAASLLMGLAVSSASAGKLSLSNTKFRITWKELEFNVPSVPAAVLCDVTIEGSFHSATLRKVEGALIGAFTRAILKNESCFAGHATLLQETLPWHFTYDGFSGTLPRIEAVFVLVRRYAIRLDIGLGIVCLYKDRGRVEENLAGYVETEEVIPRGFNEFIWNQDGYGSLSSGSEFCPRRLFLFGGGLVTLLGTNATYITIRLI